LETLIFEWSLEFANENAFGAMLSEKSKSLHELKKARIMIRMIECFMA